MTPNLARTLLALSYPLRLAAHLTQPHPQASRRRAAGEDA